MKIAGIIAEYNPFHNGHAYQIHEVKRLTSADYVVVVMSGDFVQRGEPAVVDKFVRAKMALSCGADLVLELPVRCAVGSAEYFASGAAALLQSLGCVDVLCFGAESDDLTALERIADLLVREPETYTAALRASLAQGMNFPAARSAAVALCLSKEDAALLSFPNNILAVEYLKSLQRMHAAGLSVPKPCLIPRSGSGYHDTQLDSGTDSRSAISDGTADSRSASGGASSAASFASATAIRSALLKHTRYGSAYRFGCSVRIDHDRDIQQMRERLAAYLPAPALGILCQALSSQAPVCPDDLSPMLHYRLLTSRGWEEFASCFDVSEELARRIWKLRGHFTDFETFVSEVKTRNVTELTVRRTLLHILLQLPAAPVPYCAGIFAPYCRVLGFRRCAAAVLTLIKRQGCVPLITKLADAPGVLASYEPYTEKQRDTAGAFLKETMLATQLYHSLTAASAGHPFAEEAQPLVLL